MYLGCFRGVLVQKQFENGVFREKNKNKSINPATL